MHRYRVTYRSVSIDGHSPKFTTTIRGADPLHVEEKFYDSCEDDGWEIVTIARL